MGFQQGFRINTNTASLDTYRSYTASQAGLERNIERLSSGLRINRAADDAAGLAISQRMNNQVRGMQQANRNVQQANNMMQTAEGGLNEIHNILGRMRELAVQSASDGVNGDDRASIDLEFQQLKAEITRIGNGTEYNNMKMIDGSRAKALTETANRSGATVVTDVIDLATVSTDAAFNGDTLTFAYDNNSSELSVSINGGSSQLANVSGSTITVLDSNSKKLTFDLQTGQGVAALNTAVLTVGSSALESGVAETKVSSYTANGTYTFDDDGSDTIKLTGPDSVEHQVTKAGGFSAGDEIQFDEAGIVVKLASDYSNLDGSKLEVNDGTFTTVQVGSNNDSDAPASQASVGASVTENRITYNIADATSEGLGISTVDLDSLSDAQSAINYLDSAIAKVNDERSNIGSLQNRFEFTSSNLLNSIQNNSASMSTIRDADFAVEAADLARNQILTQSGTAMLAQANSLSQNVLSLIR